MKTITLALWALFVPCAALAQDGPIPTDFFDSIVLDSPLPRQWDSGQSLALRGRVVDGAEGVLFLYTRADGAEARFSVPVAAGRFDRDIVFSHAQAGTYQLAVFTFVGDQFSFKGGANELRCSVGDGPVQVPAAFFTGLKLDAPLPSQLRAGESLPLAGNLVDTGLTQILLRFTPEDGGEPVRFFATPESGRFERILFFGSEAVGSYVLDIFAGQQGESLPFFGSFAPFEVLPTAGPVSLPRDFFPGLVLDAPLPISWAAGEALEIGGTLNDPSLTQVLLQFTPEDGGEPVQFFFAATEGRIQRTLAFSDGQTNAYRLDLFAGFAGEGLPFLGSFSPIEIIPADGPIKIPPAYFPGVVLDAPLPTRLSTGQALDLNGTVADPAHTQLMFRLLSAAGDTVRFFADVNGGRFNRQAVLDHTQAGTYTLELLAGPRYQILNLVERFSPIEVSRGVDPIILPTRFFDQAQLDHPLPAALRLGQTYAFDGVAFDDAAQIQLELKKPDGSEPRYILGGGNAGRFALPLRLRPDEAGPLQLSLLVQDIDGLFYGRGTFRIEGFSGPAPDLHVGVLALQLLTDGPGRVALENRGDAPLTLAPPTFDGPFELVTAPEQLAPGETGVVRLLHTGGFPRGEMTLRSDDPFQPVVRVALTAFDGGGFPPDLRRFEANAKGVLELKFDRRGDDYVVALYSAQVSGLDTAAVYAFGQAPAAKATAPAATGVDRFETQLRQRERRLAFDLRRSGYPAAKPAQASYAVGDRRTLIFPDFDPVPRQTVEATVVAISGRAVAFVHNNLRPDDFNVSAEQIQAFIDRFTDDYDPVVALFGAPSDVDGDGKVAFLFTHLVDELDGVGGFYNAEAVLPVESGGNGDRIDLMFISPTQPLDGYRPLLVHEFQHLVNFNQHVLVHRGLGESSWLNEGLSHLSEDLVSTPTINGNLTRSRIFLENPAATGLDGEASFDGAKRGAAYLFVRGLVDRLGDEVLLRLLQTDRVDRDNVEAATGESFEDLLAFWAAQLYARSAQAAVHPRLSYTFAPLLADLPAPAAGETLVGTLRPRGLTYIRLRGVDRSLSVQTDPHGRFGAVVLPLFQVSTAVAENSVLPLRFGLEPNRPNPFNPSTVIPFHLPRDGEARLEIYALNGQLVRTLARGPLKAGRHRARWDGRDQSGRAAASGVYLIRLQGGNRLETRKILLLK